MSIWSGILGTHQRKLVPASNSFYTTNFLLNESAISDGGHFRNGLTHGLDWTAPATGNPSGLGHGAYNTQDNNAHTDDSIAILESGVLTDNPTNHYAQGTIIRGTTGDFQEYELLLRGIIVAHTATFYEINVAHDGGYAQIVKWLGPFNSYTRLYSQNNVGALATGDVLYAQIVGTTITLKKNNSTIFSIDVTLFGDSSPYMTGLPGFGLYCGVISPPVANPQQQTIFSTWTGGAL